MKRLSETNWKLILHIFSPEYHSKVEQILLDECGNNLPFCTKSDEYELERVRFAVLKLSNGNLNELQRAVDLAKVDWRDVLMAAGFGYSATAHKEWAHLILAN